MASSSGAIWAVDIGNNSLKALRLSTESGAVEVIGFENIQHGKILTGGRVESAERDELVALSLRQFVNQQNLGKDDIIVSVPSQNSFARFVKLPPVEKKRIPEIVRFEAAQQIPFDINDVQWDWQLMTEEESTETTVGIFAIKNEIVTSSMEDFSRENLQVGYVQMASMALYNYVLYDRPDLVRSNNQATVIINIGAENTDLVVATKSTVWQRCIPMGGNAFTRAIADTFKLSFEKAEKLKRTAPMSKYARQILQAMKPVFTDLASEIQRSLGFYNSSNPNTKLSKIVAMGGGTKMRGLLKYLQQTLQIPIERPDSFKRLALSPDVSAAKFHESVCDFGVVYGLALQGLGLGRIESNLLPKTIARSMAWKNKSKYFVAASLMLLAVSLLSFARTSIDRINYDKNRPLRQKTRGVYSTAVDAGSKVENEQSRGRASAALIQKAYEPFKYRDVIPLLHETLVSVITNENNNPEQKELYKSFDDNDIKAVLKIPRKERKQIFVTSMSIYFSEDVGTAQFKNVEFLRAGSSKRRSGGGGGPEGADAYQEEMMRMMQEMGYDMGSQQPKFQRRSTTRSREGEETEAESEGEEGAGFLVNVTGYCPYETIGELLDPAGVGDDQSKWGIITRLMNLDDINDGNSPFKLYKRTEFAHFSLETGEVDLNSEMPTGIGIEDVITRRIEGNEVEEFVLVDPMTKEVISKLSELDENGREKVDRSGDVIYKINDHWFALSFKLIWKDWPGGTEQGD
ncbi:MAG: type IV pilus assembly protein PilM [Planctomycetota bacterium]|jgi:type IV pilus assembly protein PilM